MCVGKKSAQLIGYNYNLCIITEIAEQNYMYRCNPFMKLITENILINMIVKKTTVVI